MEIPFSLFNNFTVMKILGAVGMGLAIVILKLLMSVTFGDFESALQAFFLFFQAVFRFGQAALIHINSGSFPSGSSYPAWIP